MAANSKQSKLSEKGDECTFTWKVYASWDFGIANVETAHNKVKKKHYRPGVFNLLVLAYPKIKIVPLCVPPLHTPK
jgi:hypothetical protein